MLQDGFACDQVLLFCVGGCIRGYADFSMFCKESDVEAAFSLVQLRKKSFHKVCRMEKLEPWCKVELVV